MLKRLKGLLSGSAQAPARQQDGHLVNAYCTVGEVAAPPFPHDLHGWRSLADPELAQHLDGFCGYVQSRGDGAMTATRYHVLRHIQRARNQLSFTIGDGQWPALAAWANAANAILFLPDGSVRDPQARTLVSARDGSADSNALVPYPAGAWARKTRIEAVLAARECKSSAHLPPVLAEDEVRLRSPDEVAGRALALFLVAVRAESVATNAPIPVTELKRDMPLALPWLSPAERTFLDDATPSTSDTAQFAWRYEGLALLEWALGLADVLSWPEAICDVPETARRAISLHGESRMRGAGLRPVSEILDALDLHYRLHWLVRQARIDGKPAPAGLDSGVILERHYALNWLVAFEGSEWDEVDTPT